MDAVARFIESRQLLLVLDNFEPLLDGAGVVNTLLTRCSGLRILVTSRAVLNLSAERIIEPKSLAEGPAIALFARRAAAAKPGFALTADNRPVVTAICGKLDGLALAI